MAQPSGQVNLDSGHAFYGYFWYAQGSTGLWDARNGALATKTGTSAMSTDGGNNVVTGDGSTRYATGTLDITPPWTLSFRAKLTSSGTASMVCGMNNATTDFIWLNGGSSALIARTNSVSPTMANSGDTTMATYTIVGDASGAKIVFYKNGSFVSETAGTQQHLKLNYILSGYNGDSFSLNGALEFLHIMPIAATASNVSSLYSDPYQMLQIAISGTLAATDGADAAAFSGTITSSSVTGTLAAVDGADAASFSGTVTSATPTLTTPVLKNNTGTVLANETGATVCVYNVTTGALVVKKTGQTTNGSGVMTITDAAIAAATEYRVVISLASGAEGMDRITAT
jgi:hypothetical protein